jgi:hypothetical protein
MVGLKGEAVMKSKYIHVLLLLALLLISGCSGNGGTSSETPGGPTKATISFSLVSTATLPFRISGVQMNVSLPAGLIIATPGTAISSGLEVGSATTSFLIAGSYTGLNQIALVIYDKSTGQIGFGPGEMARLTYSLDAGKTMGESERLALENAITFTFKASGIDPTASASPSPLNTYLIPKVVVTLAN